jgi:hypothetical protein
LLKSGAVGSAVAVIDRILSAIGDGLNVLAGTANRIAGRYGKGGSDDAERGELTQHETSPLLVMKCVTKETRSESVSQSKQIRVSYATPKRMSGP